MKARNATRTQLHTILVASPDEQVRRSTFSILQSWNIPVREAYDFQSTVNALLFGGPFSAVILDSDTSRFSAQILLSVVVGKSMSVPCIMLTGSSENRWSKSFPTAQKPVNPTTLWNILNAAMHGQLDNVFPHFRLTA